MRGNVMVLTWDMWVAASVVSSPSSRAGDLPGPALDVPVDVDGDGIASFGDVWVFNWWLSQGADLKDVLAEAKVHDGLLDLSEYFREREARPAATAGEAAILDQVSGCNWSGETNSTTRMPPNWMTTNGQQPTGDTSEHARITPSGCFVAFSSAAGNLPGASPQGYRQIYRLEYRQGQPYELRRVSRRAGTGNNPANGHCYRPSITDDGNKVAFESEGSMGPAGDPNRGDSGPDPEDRDIFVRNEAAGTTARVSQNVGQQAPDGPSYYSAISGNGAWVAFTSTATDFGGGYQYHGKRYVFRATTSAPAGAECVSVGPNAQGRDILPEQDMQTGEDLVGGIGSVGHVISPNGKVVAFYGKGTKWNFDGSTAQAVFVRDLTNPQAKRTWLVSPWWPDGDSKSPSISLTPDTTYNIRVAYSTKDTTLDPPPPPPPQPPPINYEDACAVDVRLSDGWIDNEEKISQIGSTHGNGDSSVPVLSRSGLYVAFASKAFNLVSGDTNGDTDVFLKRSSIWAAEAIQRSSVKSDGSEADDGAIERESTSPDVTEDGAVVVFESTQRELVPGDTNKKRDVFRRYDPWLTRFVRADANDDGLLNLSDSVFILNYLFLGGEEPHCLDSADADDSGNIVITDATYIQNYLFQGGPAPPAPFPGCGEDPTGDAVTCSRFEHCGGGCYVACPLAR